MSGVLQEPHAPSAARFRFSSTLIIGIDLGSTFSGISYERFNPEDPTTPRSWNHAASVGSDAESRVPTKIPASSYSRDERFRDYLLEWFRISLLRDDDLPPHVRDSAKFTKLAAYRKLLGVSAVTATAGYLKLLWSNFHGTFGHPIFDFEYHLVIPVPAS